MRQKKKQFMLYFMGEFLIFVKKDASFYGLNAL